MAIAFYTVLVMEGTDESLLQFFFDLDRIIAWLNEVATVAHA